MQGFYSTIIVLQQSPIFPYSKHFIAVRKVCSALALFILLMVCFNQQANAQPFSTSPQGGSVATFTPSGANNLGVTRVSVSVSISTSGSYLFGLRYANSENGFIIAATDPGSFGTGNQWTSPVLSNGNKTVTFSYGTTPYGGPGNCLITANQLSPKLRLHITSTGSGHTWTHDSGNGFITAPVNSTGVPFDFYVDMTDGTPNGTLPAAPNNWLNHSSNPLSNCANNMKTYSHLNLGWFTLTLPFNPGSTSGSVTTGPASSTATQNSGTLSLSRVTMTVTQTSSGCYGYGFRYGNSENGFLVSNAGTPATFPAANMWKYSSGDGSSTINFTYGNPTATNNYTGGCMTAVLNPRLRLTITSTGTNHIWKVDATSQSVYVPISNQGASLVFTIDVTNSTPTGGPPPTNVLVNGNVPGNTCASSYRTYTSLRPGWFTLNSPTINPTITVNPICVGSTAQFNSNAVAGTYPTLTYTWSGPSTPTFNPTITNPTRSITATAQGGVYNVTVTDNGGCKPTGSVSVTVRAVPTATITVPTTTPTSICATNTTSQIITATAVSSPEIGTWTQSGPSTATSFPNTTANQTVTGMEGGSHVFTWTVSNDAPNCTASATRTVGVNQLSSFGSINGTRETFCEPFPGTGAAVDAANIPSTGLATLAGSPSSGTFTYQWQYKNEPCDSPGVTWIDLPGCSNVSSCDPTIGNLPVTSTVCIRRAVKDACNNLAGASNTREVAYVPEPNTIFVVDPNFAGCGSVTLFPDSVGNPNNEIVWLLQTAPYTYSVLDTSIYYNDLMLNTKTIGMLEIASDGATPAGWCPSYDTLWITSTVAPGFDVVITTHATNCFNENTGSAKAIPSAGTAPYSYTWSAGTPVGTPADSVRNLSSGSYSCTVTDAADCATIVSFSINQPDLLSLSANRSVDLSGSFNINCFGTNTGSIDMTVSGGNGSNIFSWTGPGGPYSTEDLSTIAAGTYALTVTDAKGCTSTGSYVMTQPPDLSVQANVGYSCSGGQYTQATIVLSGSGGVGSYQYSNVSAITGWQGSNQYTTSTGGGNFKYWVKDGDNCVDSVTVAIIGLPTSNSGSLQTCDIIYVSPGGSGNLGTKSCPTSLTGAVTIFNSAMARKRVFIAAGTYSPGVVINIPNGIIFEGGFIPSTSDDKNWVKSSSAVTTINFSTTTTIDANIAHAVGLVFNSSGGSFKMQDITINVTGPAGTTTNSLGKSVYGMHIQNAGSFELIRCKIITGNASGGAGGSQGSLLGTPLAGDGRVAAYNQGSCYYSGNPPINSFFTREYDEEKDGGWGNCDSHDNNEPGCLPDTYLAPYGGDGGEGGGGTAGGSRGNYGSRNSGAVGGTGSPGTTNSGRGGGGGGGGAGGEDFDITPGGWHNVRQGDDGGNGGAGAVGAAGATGAGGVAGGTGGSAGTTGTGGSRGGNFNCQCITIDFIFYTVVDCQTCGYPGSTGSEGGNGGPGGTGAAGPAGTFATYFTPGGRGGTGGQGGGGGGGAGGGGGGGQTGWRVDDGAGGGGGAGAGGGQGGYGGSGGYGGGIALGLYLFSNTAGRIDEISINQGSGGTGGLAGIGGVGAAGGSKGGIGGLVGKQTGNIALDLGCLFGFIACGCGNEAGPGGNGGKGGNGGTGGTGGSGSNGASADLYVSNGALSGSPLFLASGTNTLSLAFTTTYDPVKVERTQGCTNSSVYITKNSSPSGNWDLTTLPGASFIKDSTPTLSSFTSASDSAVIYFNPGVPPSGLSEYDLKIGSAYYKEFVNLAVSRGTLDTITIVDNASGNPASLVCKDALVEFKVLNGYAGYEWLIVDSLPPHNRVQPTSPSSQTSTYTFTQTGTYYVRLRYREECCGWTIPIWKKVIVETIPLGTPTITAYPNSTPIFTYCQGDTIGMEVTNVTNATNGYIWTLPIATGQILSGSTTDSISMVIGSTTDTIKVSGKNQCGDGAQGKQKITIKPQPVAIISGPIEFCTGQSVTLQNVVSGLPGYLWSPGGATTNSVSVSTGATYTVSVTGANGCSKISSPHTVVDLGPNYVWTGLAHPNNSWHNPANWTCGVPDKTKNVIIPTVPRNVTVGSGVPNWPEVKATLTGNCKTIVVETGAQITLIGTGLLNVNKP